MIMGVKLMGVLVDGVSRIVPTLVLLARLLLCLLMGIPLSGAAFRSAISSRTTVSRVQPPQILYPHCENNR